MNPRFLIGIVKALTLGVLVASISTACAGSKKQAISPQQKPSTESEEAPGDGEVDPSKEIDQGTDPDADEEIDDTDLDSDDTDDTDDSDNSGIKTLVSLLPIVLNLANGQMPDVNSILNLIPGGSGGALSGVGDLLTTGLLGGTTTP